MRILIKAGFSKSPKAVGEYDKPFKLGSTRSGKDIYSHQTHSDHAKFSTHDHMDAYHAHARHAQSLHPDTHRGLFQHHKNAMLHHWKAANSLMKSLNKMRAHHRAAMKALDHIIKHGHSHEKMKEFGHHSHKTVKHHRKHHAKKKLKKAVDSLVKSNSRRA